MCVYCLQFEQQRDANVQLTGHNNLGQKIKMHEQLKREVSDERLFANH